LFEGNWIDLPIFILVISGGDKMISLGDDGKTYVHWVQNGIRNKRGFRSTKEAERFQELLEDIQDSMKICEEVGKLSKDINYDPNIINLKVEKVGKEIEALKERLKIKQTLQKKLGDVVNKLAEQPRNVIDRETFLKEIKQLKTEISRLDRFFREHAIVSLHNSLYEAIKEMKGYFHYQKEAVKKIEDVFRELGNELSKKFASITTRDRVLSLEEAAKYLGASYSSIREKMLLGKLPFFKVGNRYKVKENDLLKWIEDSRKKNKILS
jgi:excisionase family DNA binding protein